MSQDFAACPPLQIQGETLTCLNQTGVGVLLRFCLLYTSDAADEEDSVDLGGRRII